LFILLKGISLKV